ncbi:MAG: LppA family lipoprotein [Segniliparus sp.]|uniref:LppA family lipoprotein n=1 Tax=Segniliparus sp. TaxID=2804064 RepID=UPI003F381ECC
MANPVDERGWFKRHAKWLWTGLAVLLVAVLVACGIGAYRFLEGLKGMDDEPQHMAKSDVPAFEERYRDKGSVQQAAKELEAAIAKTADKIAALVPGLTWKWQYDQGNVGCPQDKAADTRVTRFATRLAGFESAIPEDVWPQAVAIARADAEFLGMTDKVAYQDAAKNHDIVFSSEDGGEIRIGTAVEASIRGKTPCRLMEDWYTSRNIPVPGKS